MLTAFSRSSAFLKSAILAKGDFIMTLFDQIRSFRRIVLCEAQWVLKNAE